MRQLGLALQQFVGDNHVYPLDVNPDFKKGSYQNHDFSWIETLGHELNKPIQGRVFKDVWKCPSAERPPTFPPNSPYSFYGYNANGVSTQTNTNSLGLGGHFVRHFPSRPPAPPIAESEVASPSEMIAIGDGFVGGNGNILDGAAWLQRNSDTKDSSGSTARASARHQGKAGVAFCDGHVESPTLKFLFEETNDVALVRWNRDHQPHRERLTP